jgi:hypothetical protein
VSDDVRSSVEHKGWVSIELSSNNMLPEVPVVSPVFALVEVLPGKHAGTGPFGFSKRDRTGELRL